MARAAKAHGASGDAYVKAVGADIAREIAPLSREVVENGIKEAKAGAETMGEGRAIGYLREVVQPVVDTNQGALSSDFAPALVNVRLLITAVLYVAFIVLAVIGLRAWRRSAGEAVAA